MQSQHPPVVPLGCRSGRLNSNRTERETAQNRILTSLSDDRDVAERDLAMKVKKLEELKEFKSPLKRIIDAHTHWKSDPNPELRRRLVNLKRLYVFLYISGRLNIDLPYGTCVQIHESVKNICQVMRQESSNFAGRFPWVSERLFFEVEKENVSDLQSRNDFRVVNFHQLFVYFLCLEFVLQVFVFGIDNTLSLVFCK
ncbi:uncharacterized protein LOC129598767 [Paramacrobiotus metropolitanus]|uniref:uncharacterized protein LOC129598767 n=1 Tax=Paramacrobiotus metropolitanus TaxID=2943436 RepID=UPI002445C13C|nr:uncharacterized protein LOC129598767 [Paramacrobiotus metropolitanus]